MDEYDTIAVGKDEANRKRHWLPFVTTHLLRPPQNRLGPVGHEFWVKKAVKAPEKIR